jgi:hypothetical protein
MKRFQSIARLSLLAGVLFLLLPQPGTLAQSNPMTCIECHADPALGGFHGGFRAMTNLTSDQVDVVCLSCHDGSYTDPQGNPALEAAVHENPGEFGTWKAGCRDCHTNHSPLLAGDGTGNSNLMLLGRKVREASSTDGVARIRKPIILDVNGDNGGSDSKRYEDDIQTGWECNSGIDDDPACIESDPPAAGDGVRKLVFYVNIDSDATNWAQASPPYNGACNVCHTRTAHHRRDDSGGDHTHKLPQPCTNCHNHDAGWTNKGG